MVSIKNPYFNLDLSNRGLDLTRCVNARASFFQSYFFSHDMETDANSDAYEPTMLLYRWAQKLNQLYKKWSLPPNQSGLWSKIRLYCIGSSFPGSIMVAPDRLITMPIDSVIFLTYLHDVIDRHLHGPTNFSPQTVKSMWLMSHPQWCSIGSHSSWRLIVGVVGDVESFWQTLTRSQSHFDLADWTPSVS